MNMDNNLLINGSFNDAYAVDGKDNIKSAKFINLQQVNVSGNPKDTVEYSVTIDFTFKKEITSSSGKQPRFIILKKESDKSGWRIQSEGTGP
jgi:Tfp pilus assembly protein PilX